MMSVTMRQFLTAANKIIEARDFNFDLDGNNENVILFRTSSAAICSKSPKVFIGLWVHMSSIGYNMAINPQLKQLHEKFLRLSENIEQDELDRMKLICCNLFSSTLKSHHRRQK